MTAFLDEDDVWVELINRPRRTAFGPALFLDRDGVIIEDGGHTHRPEDVELTPGAAAAIRTANQAGAPVIVVTNQGGIGLGLYGFQDFQACQARMYDLLAAEGAFVNLTCASPHHPRGSGSYAHPNHPGRKPNPGMLLKAAERVPLDLRQSWIVGDRRSDLMAGRRAGLAGGAHVLTGHGAEGDERIMALEVADADYPVHGADTLAAAVANFPFLTIP